MENGESACCFLCGHHAGRCQRSRFRRWFGTCRKLKCEPWIEWWRQLTCDLWTTGGKSLCQTIRKEGAAVTQKLDRATYFYLLGGPWFVARGLPTIYDDDGIQQRVRRDAKLYLLAMEADYMAMVQYMSLKLFYFHQNYQGESRKPQ